MKNPLSALFGLLFAASLGAALFLTLIAGNAPIITDSLTEAEAQTQRLMDAVCSGDYAAAEELLTGGLRLVPEGEHSSALTQALWDAYIDTLSYSFHGGCYADDYGLYRDVTVTILDIPALLNDLPIGLGRTEDEQAADVQSALAKGDYTATRTLTLQLTGHGGRWMIHATPQLVDLMQGSMGGA